MHDRQSSLLVLAILIEASSGALPLPDFVGSINNVTVTAGRDAILTCQVEHLRGYKVAWVQVDTQTILTIHNTVITRNPRIGLSRDEQNVYNLHVKDSQEEDRGWYMCQINTDPMIKQIGFLQVVVPPDFEETSSGDKVVREGSNISLACRAKGYPPPTVTWRREDPKDTTQPTTHVWEGETLVLEKVSRTHMGAFLCVASNGIQPTVSKRIILKVQFPPMLWIPNQLEGAKWGESTELQCNTEAYPKSINYWTNHRGEMIADTYKYTTMTVDEGSYITYMRLTIHNLTDVDFSVYKCIAKNSLGETDGAIKLYEIPPRKKKEAKKSSKLSSAKEGDEKDINTKENPKMDNEDDYKRDKTRRNSTKYTDWDSKKKPMSDGARGFQFDFGNTFSASDRLTSWNSKNLPHIWTACFVYTLSCHLQALVHHLR